MGKQKDIENNRELTKAEKQRKERFEQTKAQLEAQGYKAHDLTIGLVYANVMAFVLSLPIIAILAVGFFLNNSKVTISSDLNSLIRLIIYLVAFFVLIILHELIHGITWAIFTPRRWKAISFGFIVQYLTPYCSCSDALKKGAYITGGIMPTILLGIIPCVVAIFSGSLLLFIIGAIMIFSGGGDLTIILKLLRFRSGSKDVCYLDHPYQAGLVVFTRE